MKQKRYDTIFWDVDGTLLNFLKSERWALIETFRKFGFQIDDEIVSVYSRINDSFWKRLERGEIDKLQVLRGRFLVLFEQLGPQGPLAGKGLRAEALAAIDVDAFRMEYQKNLGSVYYYLDDSLLLCRQLKEEGFAQYIITNGVKWTQSNKLHLAGFDTVMDDIFISEEIGFNKPDKRFFDICFERMGDRLTDKSRILVVGDSVTSDMKGAQQAGLDGCLYLEGKKRQDAAGLPGSVKYQIGNLWDVRDIIWQNQQIRS